MARDGRLGHVLVLVPASPLPHLREIHTLAGEEGGAPNSDDWTDTLVLYIVIPSRTCLLSCLGGYVLPASLHLAGVGGAQAGRPGRGPSSSF